MLQATENSQLLAKNVKKHLSYFLPTVGVPPGMDPPGGGGGGGGGWGPSWGKRGGGHFYKTV